MRRTRVIVRRHNLIRASLILDPKRMTYYKLGCRWGEDQPSFYEMLIKKSIVIGQCVDPQKYPGDIILIADGHDVLALAEVVGERKLCTAMPELESEFSKYNIAYDNSTCVADAEIWELPEEKRFKYEETKGRCEVGKKEVIQTASSLMAEFKRSQLEEKCSDLLKSNKNLILTGAPGTGKTFAAKKIAELMEDATWELVQFHPSYDYTDFVEGLRPVMNSRRGIGFERKDGVFKEFCKRALRDVSKKPYVFIIDEINRGEISKIFGELFYSIDRGCRGEEGCVKTQYQNLVPEDDPFYEGFYVPNNVYIIGTMNDIDRSVESIDFAMRRRFAWVEFTAKESQSMLDSDDAWGEAKKKPENLGEIKERMDRLNDCIVSDEIGLTRAYQIGAAYFLKYAPQNGFDALWNNHLKGVLYEYLRGSYDIDDKMKKLEDAYDNRRL